MTRIIPFYANYGVHPDFTLRSLEKRTSAAGAHKNVERLKTLHKQLLKDIRFISEWAALYYNKTYKNTPSFREKEKVYLLYRNLIINWLSKILNFKKLGLYRIIKKLNNINYELRLLKGKGKSVYPMFHISLLEKADQHIPESRNKIPVDDWDEYKVEKILAKDSQRWYLIKWRLPTIRKYLGANQELDPLRPEAPRVSGASRNNFKKSGCSHSASSTSTLRDVVPRASSHSNSSILKIS